MSDILSTSKLTNILEISNLFDIDFYSSFIESSILHNDQYVSVKVSTQVLNNFIFNENNVKTSLSYDLFDVYYTCAKNVPEDAWSLVIDKSISIINSSSNTAPNWLYNSYIPTVHQNIETSNNQFWTKLLDYADRNLIRFEKITNIDEYTINATTYMREYKTYGYTGIFLIDVTNKFVALPIFNNSFIRTVKNPGVFESLNIGVCTDDMIKNHYHIKSGYSQTVLQPPFNINFVKSDTYETYESDTQSDGDVETRPKNTRMIPVIQVKTDISVQKRSITYNKNSSNVPIGAILPYTETTLNNKFYLICDGSMCLISEYSELFSKIGHRFSNTSDIFDRTKFFKLPDFRNKYISYTTNTNKLFKNTLKNTSIHDLIKKHYHGFATPRNGGIAKIGNLMTSDPLFNSSDQIDTSINTSYNYITMTGVGTDCGNVYTSSGALGTSNGIPLKDDEYIEPNHILVNFIIKAK